MQCILQGRACAVAMWVRWVLGLLVVACAGCSGAGSLPTHAGVLSAGGRAPSVAVAIVTHGRPLFLQHALWQVRQQEWVPDEVVRFGVGFEPACARQQRWRNAAHHATWRS